MGVSPTSRLVVDHRKPIMIPLIEFAFSIFPRIRSLLHTCLWLLPMGLPLSSSAQGLPEPVASALRNAQIPASSVAVMVHPVNGKTPIVDHNAKQAMNPASVMKLVTTYAALDLLGPAHTWKTEVLSDVSPSEGRLDGHLYLRGNGDPKFYIEHFWALLRQLRVRGIQHINGDLILDRSTFALPVMDPGAFDDRPLRPYNVGPDALLINFRALRFTLRPEGHRLHLWTETPSEGLQIDNKLQLVNSSCPSDWKDRINPRLIQEKSGLRLEFNGIYSHLCGERNLNLSPLNADQYAEGLFRALWKELGGTFKGQVRAAVTPPQAKLLAFQESPALAEIVRDINKYSNNVMARQLYLSLGEGQGPNTTEKSRLRIDQWLSGRNLHFPELEIDNGSGLSRQERISAGSLNRLLLDAWNSEVMPELVSSLPIVGTDGTMRRRLKASEASGRAHIKTGTLDGVKSAAGFAQNAKGQRYVVTFLINHPRAAAGQAAIDALLLWIAQLP